MIEYVDQKIKAQDFSNEVGLPSVYTLREHIKDLEKREGFHFSWRDLKDKSGGRLQYYKGIKVLRRDYDGTPKYDVFIYEGDGNYAGGDWLEEKVEMRRVLAFYIERFGLDG